MRSETSSRPLHAKLMYSFALVRLAELSNEKNRNSDTFLSKSVCLSLSTLLHFYNLSLHELTGAFSREHCMNYAIRRLQFNLTLMTTVLLSNVHHYYYCGYIADAEIARRLNTAVSALLLHSFVCRWVSVR